MPSTQLSPDGFRVAAAALRERPVVDPASYTEPVGSEPSDPDCRVCFVAAMAAGFLPLGQAQVGFADWIAALALVEDEVDRLPEVEHHSLTQALDQYGPEFCALLCEGIADDMEAASA